jgi:signal transduction histidine kinase
MLLPPLSAARCPLAGFPVRHNPSWVFINAASTYSLQIGILGNNILVVQSFGYAEKSDIHQAEDLTNKIIAENFAAGSDYIHLTDFTHLKGTSLAGRKYYIESMLKRNRLTHLIFYGLSPLLSMSVKLGTRLHTTPFKIFIVRDYAAAAQLLREIPSAGAAPSVQTGDDGPVQRADTVHVDADLINRSVTNPGWNIEIEGLSIESEVINDNIMHTQSQGFMEEVHLEVITQLTEKITAEKNGQKRFDYFISGTSGLIGTSGKARLGFLEMLKQLYDEHQFRLYLVYGANRLIRAAIYLMNPFLPFKLRVATDFRQALRLALDDQQSARKTPAAVLPAAKQARPLAMTTELYAQELLEYLGLIKWDKAGFEIDKHIDTAHPFYEVFEGICLIKNELDELNQKRNEAEEQKKKLQSQLDQAQKLKSIGTLAGGVAHDFNNLLTNILGNVSLMLLDKDPHSEEYGHMKTMENNILSAAKLTQQLLGLARGGKYEVKPTDLNEIVTKSAQMFGRTKKEITIHMTCQADLWTTEVDQDQIDQVLLNLYVNAWQAMPDGGEIRLETKNVVLDELFTKRYALSAGRYVLISVADTGIGIDKSTQKQIFDPFFTTKQRERGTGLGLASSYGIIANHHGIINVYSEVGQGSIFNVYLPASNKNPVLKQTSPAKIFKGQGRILFVDDEEIMVDIGQRILNKLGYEVVIARSGAEAIELYQAECQSINLVLLDMIMPGMNGSETFDRLQQIDPNIKVLLSSGYSLDGDAQKILERGGRGFIQKPFSLSLLSQKINDII